MTATIEAGDVAAELKAFYDHYIRCFNSGDEAAANACYAYPWNLLTDNRVIAMTGPEDGRAMLEALYQRIGALGWTATGIDSVEAWPAGRDSGLLKVFYRRMRGDGSVIETGSCCYMTEKADGRWRFTGVVDSFVGQNRLV